jgi:hypothetical protein
MSKRLSHSQLGFTLIDLVVAIFALSMMMMILSASINTAQVSMFSIKRSVTADELHQNLMQAMVNKNAIAYTCQKNPAFAKCFVTGPGSCQAGISYPVNLYDSTGRQIGGSAASPVLFTRDGSPCAAGAVLGVAGCDYSVVTTFQPQGHPADCGNGCEDLQPRDFPPNNMLHELLLISFQVNTASVTQQQLPDIAQKIGSVTIPLDDVYGNTGCPSVP